MKKIVIKITAGKFVLICSLLFVVIVMNSCSGPSADADNRNSFQDKESIDTMIIQNVKTGGWDTNIVKHMLKYNPKTKKYDTTDVFLKKQAEMPPVGK